MAEGAGVGMTGIEVGVTEVMMGLCTSMNLESKVGDCRVDSLGDQTLMQLCCVCATSLI